MLELYAVNTGNNGLNRAHVYCREIALFLYVIFSFFAEAKIKIAPLIPTLIKYAITIITANKSACYIELLL